MDKKEIKKIYDTLLETGELLDFMPEAKGVWRLDKGDFTLIQSGLETCIEDPDQEGGILDLFHEREEMNMFATGGEDEEEEWEDTYLNKDDGPTYDEDSIFRN